MTRLQRERYVKRCIKRVADLYPSTLTLESRTRYDSKNMGYCISEPEYMRAAININIDLVKKERDIARTVFHEMLHLPTWGLFSVARDLAKNIDGAKFAKKQVDRANETATSLLEEMFFTLVFPEFE